MFNKAFDYAKYKGRSDPYENMIEDVLVRWIAPMYTDLFINLGIVKKLVTDEKSLSTYEENVKISLFSALTILSDDNAFLLLKETNHELAWQSFFDRICRADLDFNDYERARRLEKMFIEYEGKKDPIETIDKIEKIKKEYRLHEGGDRYFARPWYGVECEEDHRNHSKRMTLTMLDLFLQLIEKNVSFIKESDSKFEFSRCFVLQKIGCFLWNTMGVLADCILNFSDDELIRSLIVPNKDLDNNSLHKNEFSIDFVDKISRIIGNRIYLLTYFEEKERAVELSKNLIKAWEDIGRSEETLREFFDKVNKPNIEKQAKLVENGVKDALVKEDYFMCLYLGEEDEAKDI